MKENRTAPAQGGPEKTGAGNDSTPTPIKFTARQQRQRRILLALLERPVSREELDRIAGASNGPDVVYRLRRRGIVIVCEYVKHTDRDGVKGWHGVYRLPASERERLGGDL